MRFRTGGGVSASGNNTDCFRFFYFSVIRRRPEVFAREPVHPPGRQAGERVAVVARPVAEDRRLRDRVQRRGRRPAVRGVRVHAVVPVAGVPVDARPVRHQDGRVGGRLRAVRGGHQAAAVRRRGRGRPAGENRRAAGRPGPAAGRPVPEARVGSAGRAVRRDRRGATGDAGRGRRAARGVPAAPARLRAAEGHGRVRPGQAHVGRPAVAEAVLPADEVHRIRTRADTVSDVAVRGRRAVLLRRRRAARGRLFVHARGRRQRRVFDRPRRVARAHARFHCGGGVS